jgi:catechol 2,3-dioxygenase-like lactoylglutathione lyase family enzyme
MIKRMSHVTIYVEDHDRAHDFYVGKLGFEVRTDAKMDNGFRWLTVGPKGQPELEIALMRPTAGMSFDAESVVMIAELRKRGSLGGGVFQTDDCHKTYEELRARGVEFRSPPAEKPYGIEALFVDDSGNWFSLTQH